MGCGPRIVENLSEPRSDAKGGLAVFFVIACILGTLRILLGLVPVPATILPAASAVVTGLFVLLPFIALFKGAEIADRWRTALALLITGAAAHVLSWLALGQGWVDGLAAALVSAAGQVGLLCWSLGLGVLLARVVRDKNIIVPVCIFLAIFDVFLVLTPIGPTQAVLKRQPNLMQAVAFSIPKVQAAPAAGPVSPAAHVGPADLLFSAFFFALLYRFGMSVRKTAFWLAPTLVVYLFAAMWIGSLPALVPIGACVLLVNIRHFKLTRQEWASTAIFCGLALAGLIWGLTRPKQPPGTSPVEVVQDGGAPAGSLPPAP